MLVRKGVVVEQALLFWAGTTVGVEAARGTLAGGGKGDALVSLLRSSTGVLNSLVVLEFGLKSSCFVIITDIFSGGYFSDELFWILLKVETTCACPVLLLLPGTKQNPKKQLKIKQN